jgi:hypothetical protein
MQMKKILITIILVITGINCQAQDTINPICKQRGHIKGDVCSSTLMYCEPYIIDTDTSSIMVYPACNWLTYYCIRCGAEIVEQEPEYREILWQGEKNPNIKLSDTTTLIEPKFVYPAFDTLSSYSFTTPTYVYERIVPPKDKITRVWQKGKAYVWMHKVDSITFR